MQDPALLEATGSEPLSMDEEIQMQQEWRDDEKKCTFIILARDLIDEGEISSSENIVPPPPTAETEINDETKRNTIYPHFVDLTLDAMIGDVNLFLSEEEPEYDESGDEQIEQTTSQSISPRLLSQAELDLMIAAPSHRHKNLGTELALMMMHYGAKYLQIRRFFVKIKENNHSSLKLFKEKLGFVQFAYVACFGEYELECKCDNSEQMIDWIESRWQWWCHEGKKNNGLAADIDGKECNGDDAIGGVGKSENEVNEQSACRIYDIYKCPLNSES